MRRSAASGRSRPINLALQGGGAHGAFTWGVLDRLLEDPRVTIEGLSGTSAGTINAVVLACGLLRGGRDGAREALARLWDGVAALGAVASPVRRSPWELMLTGGNASLSPTYQAFRALTETFSPYQLNPGNVNPLRDLIESQVDFEALRSCREVKLFVSATRVRDGKIRVFRNHEVTADVVLASACLPQYFQAVEVEGHAYWDGGFTGNPALFPFFYECDSRDVVIVHVNPIVRDEVPMLPEAIANRVNEITFNSSLVAELRAIAFVQRLVADGWLEPEKRSRLRYIRMHAIRADRALADQSEATKFDLDFGFLAMLRDRGRETAAAWLERTWPDVGRRSSVDIRREYLKGSDAGAPPEPAEPPRKKGRPSPGAVPMSGAARARGAGKVRRRSSTRSRRSTGRSGS
ncbi:MAG: patatin-like phospholipase family protein [Burkholderiales bacterium]|nr:patatin-like phospholipase family protein [Burkholderiales bacterium]MCE7876827.1 patatin-like phospholipase family protein [Betaproteobacteria bacterium PRO3]